MAIERPVAVLALQGDFEAHTKALEKIGLDAFEARNPEEIEGAAGLVIPGGESTTLWKFFEHAPWETAITRFAASGRPILGTCAGAIVLSRIDRVVYGASDPKAGACDSLYRLASDPRLNHRSQVVSGLLREECSAVLKEFFQQRRLPN